MHRLLLASLLVPFLCTCGRAPETSDAVTSPAFFDLATYMDTEIARLTDGKITGDKSITLNGVTESKEDVAINYKTDLLLFRAADINKPAWRDKYETEETAGSGSHKTTVYTTLDSSLVVQRLLVEEDQGVPVRIEIDRKTGTVLSDGKHQLVYRPGRGYSVTTRQQNRFGDDVDARIDVNW